MSFDRFGSISRSNVCGKCEGLCCILVTSAMFRRTDGLAYIGSESNSKSSDIIRGASPSVPYLNILNIRLHQDMAGVMVMRFHFLNFIIKTTTKKKKNFRINLLW